MRVPRTERDRSGDCTCRPPDHRSDRTAQPSDADPEHPSRDHPDRGDPEWQDEQVAQPQLKLQRDGGDRLPRRLAARRHLATVTADLCPQCAAQALTTSSFIRVRARRQWQRRRTAHCLRGPWCNPPGPCPEKPPAPPRPLPRRRLTSLLLIAAQEAATPT